MFHVDYSEFNQSMNVSFKSLDHCIGQKKDSCQTKGWSCGGDARNSNPTMLVKVKNLEY